jgi:cellulose synthase/poly-beta-1,6-N-acetylglucosamine synthase-like glycosyltransferase
VEWLFFGYFIAIYSVYAILNIFAVFRIRRYLQVTEFTTADNIFSSLDLPVSVIVPAYNESDSIITSTRAMLQMEYPDYEVIVVNDGSTDDTLQKLIDEFNLRPFLEEPNTVATGGTVRIANGCVVRGGFLEKVGLPSNFLALVQVVEYLRAFLYGRMGWTQMNAVLIISGAFGVFDKEAVVRVGGYDAEAIGEDMELILRLHRYFCESGEDYKITFVPDPICWTDAPEDLDTLGKQRIRWQHGLGQSLALHKDLLFGRNTGAVGWLAIPFFYLFELLGPLVEISGYVFMIIGGLNGWVSWETAATFFCLAIGLGVMLSTSALVLEEMSFHVYPRIRDLLKLFAVAVLENFGYRQITLVWRIQGLVGWLRGKVPEWGEMKRSASLSEQ